MAENPYKPPSSRKPAVRDTVARARSTARWMRVLAVLDFVGATLFVGAAVALATQIPEQPGVAIILLVVLAPIVAVFVALGVWLLRAASRLRRGVDQQSATEIASAFIPLRRYFIAGFVLDCLTLILMSWSH